MTKAMKEHAPSFSHHEVIIAHMHTAPPTLLEFNRALWRDEFKDAKHTGGEGGALERSAVLRIPQVFGERLVREF